MRSLTAIVVTLLAGTLGCNVVTVDEPFGDPMPAATLDSYRGAWGDDQGNIFFVERGAGSDLVVATERNGKADGFETISFPIWLRKFDKRTLLFHSTDLTKDSKLAFVWISDIKDGAVYGRACKLDEFRPLIIDGTLKGSIQKGMFGGVEIHVEDIGKLKALLASSDGDRFFVKEIGDPLRRLDGKQDGEEAPTRRRPPSGTPRESLPASEPAPKEDS